MIFADEMQRWQERYGAEGPANVRRFMETWQLDQATIEQQVRRSAPPGQLYYVSTVPRGLAGSTSDLDFFVIIAEDCERTSDLTQMSFADGRRIGAKAFRRSEVLDGLRTAALIAGQWECGEPLSERLPVRWVHLERLVNAVTFDGPQLFAEYLPDVARWSVAQSSDLFAKACFMRTAAAQAHDLPACRAYGEAAVLAAMDLIMSACGQVQTNAKWLYQRWSAFGSEVANQEVGQLIRLVDEFRAEVEGRVRTPDLASLALAELAGWLDTLRSGEPFRTEVSVGPAAGLAIDPFIDGALVLQAAQGAVVVGKDTYQAIIDAPLALALADARQLLALTQQGFLQLETRRVANVR